MSAKLRSEFLGRAKINHVRFYISHDLISGIIPLYPKGHFVFTNTLREIYCKNYYIGDI